MSTPVTPMTVPAEFLPAETGPQPRVYFDAMKDLQGAAGLWACTVDDPEGGYDIFHGATPNEAYLAWKEGSNSMTTTTIDVKLDVRLTFDGAAPEQEVLFALAEKAASRAIDAGEFSGGLAVKTSLWTLSVVELS